MIGPIVIGGLVLLVFFVALAGLIAIARHSMARRPRTRSGAEGSGCSADSDGGD